MNESGSRMRELPNALTDGDAFAERLPAGARPCSWTTTAR